MHHQGTFLKGPVQGHRFKDEKFLNIIRDFDEKEKLIAYVCVAALPLARSGILEERRCGYVHLYGVSSNCSLLAMKRGLNIELCSMLV